MIDAETGGCQKTTRVEQALETLQTIMTGVRNGQIGSYDLPLLSTPAASSSLGRGRIDVFAQGNDTALWHKWWEPTSDPQGVWHDWESFGGILTSAPALISIKPGAVEVFVRGSDNGLWHLSYDGQTASDWSSMGGALGSAPVASSQDEASFDVFGLGPNGGIVQFSGGFDPYTSTYYGGPAPPPAPIGSPPSGGIDPNWPPAIGLTATGDYDLFVLGGDRALWHCPSVNGSWASWTSLGGQFSSGPGIVTGAPGTLDAFVCDIHSAVSRIHYVQNTGVWSTSYTQSLGGLVQSGTGPGASPRGSGLLDVFVVGLDQALWHESLE